MNTTDKQPLLKAFGLRLATLRTQQRMSVRFLAGMSRLDPSDIHKYEKGTVAPSLITIFTLAKALNIELHQLLIFENPQSYKRPHRSL